MLKMFREPNVYNPSEVQIESVDYLKAASNDPPIPSLPKLGNKYMIDKDASSYTIIETLLQQVLV